LSSESRFHCVPFSTRRTKSAVQRAICRYSGFDDRGDGVAALAEPGAVDAIAVVHEHHGADDGAGVLRAHVKLLAERRQRHLEVLDERVGLVLGVERVLVRALDGVLGPVVDLAERGREVRPLELGERVRHEHRLHELLRHRHVEERPGLLALAHLDQALALVEVHVRERADGDGDRRVLALLGGVDHQVGDPDELFLDRGRLLGFLRHGLLLLPARAGASA
jgi:hypothetical protein